MAGFGPTCVALAGVLLGEIDLALPIIHHVDLAFDHIRPAWRERVFEVGHEHARTGVQRIDDHLARCGPGDFNATVEQIVRNWRNFPIALPDRLGFGQEAGQAARVPGGLPLRAGLHEGGAAAARSGARSRPELRAPLA